jgi:hypothetical protein
MASRRSVTHCWVSGCVKTERRPVLIASSTIAPTRAGARQAMDVLGEAFDRWRRSLSVTDTAEPDGSARGLRHLCLACCCRTPSTTPAIRTTRITKALPAAHPSNPHCHHVTTGLPKRLLAPWNRRRVVCPSMTDREQVEFLAYRPTLPHDEPMPLSGAGGAGHGRAPGGPLFGIGVVDLGLR